MGARILPPMEPAGILPTPQLRVSALILAGFSGWQGIGEMGPLWAGELDTTTLHPVAEASHQPLWSFQTLGLQRGLDRKMNVPSKTTSLP